MKKNIYKELEKRVLVISGPVGSNSQNYKLSEEDFRGERFKNHPVPVKGNIDLLTLTQPGIVREIQEGFLDAGTDIIETNTFSANSISQLDYEMENLVYEQNLESAKICRQLADDFTKKTPEKPRNLSWAFA